MFTSSESTLAQTGQCWSRFHVHSTHGGRCARFKNPKTTSMVAHRQRIKYNERLTKLTTATGKRTLVQGRVGAGMGGGGQYEPCSHVKNV